MIGNDDEESKTGDNIEKNERSSEEVLTVEPSKKIASPKYTDMTKNLSMSLMRLKVKKVKVSAQIAAKKLQIHPVKPK